jgi:hypothetical protein
MCTQNTEKPVWGKGKIFCNVVQPKQRALSRLGHVNTGSENQCCGSGRFLTGSKVSSANFFCRKYALKSIDIYQQKS